MDDEHLRARVEQLEESLAETLEWVRLQAAYDDQWDDETSWLATLTPHVREDGLVSLSHAYEDSFVRFDEFPRNHVGTEEMVERAEALLDEGRFQAALGRLRARGRLAAHRRGEGGLLAQLELAVVEEASLADVGTCTTDHGDGRTVVHGARNPARCATVLLGWLDEGRVQLYDDRMGRPTHRPDVSGPPSSGHGSTGVLAGDQARQLLLAWRSWADGDDTWLRTRLVGVGQQVRT